MNKQKGCPVRQPFLLYVIATKSAAHPLSFRRRKNLILTDKILHSAGSVQNDTKYLFVYTFIATRNPSKERTLKTVPSLNKRYCPFTPASWPL